MNRRFHAVLAHPGWVIFVLALLVRVFWVSTLKPDYYWGDERAFAQVARGLVAGEGYVSTSYRANPVLPVYMALVFHGFGENLFVGRIGLCLAGALTCWLIYRLGVVLFAPAVGVCAGLILALYPSHVYLSGVFYAEGLMICLGAAGMLLAAKVMCHAPRLSWALLAGVALGLAALARSTVALWLPLTILAWGYAARSNWRRWAGLSALLLVGGAAVLVPWALRNAAVFGKPIPVSSGFGTTFWQANNPASTGRHTDWRLQPNNHFWLESLSHLPPDQLEPIRSHYEQVQLQIRAAQVDTNDFSLAADSILLPLGVQYALAHPQETVTRAVRRLGLVYSAFSWTMTTNDHTTSFYRVVAAVSYYPVLVLALTGLVLGWPERRKLAILYLAIASITIITALLTGTQTRYRLPLDPYLILFASLTLVRLTSSLARWVTREAIRDSQ